MVQFLDSLGVLPGVLHGRASFGTCQCGPSQSWLSSSQSLYQTLFIASSPPPPTLPLWRSGSLSLLAGLPPMIVPSHTHCVCGSRQVVLREVGEGDTMHCCACMQVEGVGEGGRCTYRTL